MLALVASGQVQVLVPVIQRMQPKTSESQETNPDDAVDAKLNTS
jgi:hypothetical protein